MKLWYDRPARRWQEALPLGNGSTDAMVHGGIEREIVALNEDALLRDEVRNRPVKKTLTIPRWLNAEAKRQRVSFWQVLKSALCERLGV